ncbi:hypothetical protein [Nocardia amikacinitolerans]|nr:hypothetical protein [Nocardia amikacinitolerans]
MTTTPDALPLRISSGAVSVELPSSLELFGFGSEDEPPSPA